ncbi:MAG: PAS domain S-box protein [Desulfobacteraceae bacterium]|nr:PAS domain S-box protein [Desulfobacteraceae bacterium]
MLILCVVYDTVSISAISRKYLRDSLTGVLVGLICIAVMLDPWPFEHGIYFDTRSVLISLSGLFFGLIPTAIAVVIAGAFRLYQDGAGSLVGTVVIVVTACIGLAGKQWRDKNDKPLNWMQLYFFGIVVHLGMLSCMFLFPTELRNSILKKSALPVMLIYPILTTVIGLLLKKQEDRRTAESKLLYSTSLATAALEASPDGILIVNRDGKITHWNQKFVELWHVPPHLLDMTDDKAILAHASSQMANPEEFMAKVIELCGHPEKSGTDTIYLADGRIFERFTQPKKAGNEIVGRFWQFHDITEQRKADESLRMMQFCVEHAGYSMFWVNSEGRIMYVNDAACAGLGFSREELLGMSIFDLDPDYQSGVWATHFEDLKRRGNIILETRHRAKDGHVFPVEVNANYVHFGSHDFNFAFTRDISGRKRMETALAESEEHFHQLFVQNWDGAMLLNQDTFNVVDANPALLSLFGFSLAEMQQPKPWPLIVPRYADRFMKLLGDANQQGEAFLEKGYCRCKDGTEIIVSAKAKLIRFKKENLLYCSIRDISDRIRLQEEKAETQSKLIHANKMTSLGLLVSGIAHEINNPNQYLSMNASVLAGIWEDSAKILSRYRDEHGEFMLKGMSFTQAQQKVPRLLIGITEGSQRINLIVNNLKDFARDNRGQSQSTFDVNKAIQAALQILNHHIHKHTYNFQLELDTNIPCVTGKIHQIEQVIINLITNALQALSDKTQTVRLTTSYEADSDSVVVSVSDQGKGMTQDILERITEPFFSTNLDAGGTGLGLSISAAILKDHGGTLEFASESDAGTTATIRLPAARTNL